MYLSLIKTLTVKPGSVSLRSHKCTEFGPNQFGSVIVFFLLLLLLVLKAQTMLMLLLTSCHKLLLILNAKRPAKADAKQMMEKMIVGKTNE